MNRLPVAFLAILLLLFAACAASKPPRGLLTDAQMEAVTANTLEDDQDTPIPPLATRDSTVFQNNETRINVPIGLPGSSSFWTREPVPAGIR